MPGLEDLRRPLLELIDEGHRRCRASGVHGLVFCDREGAVVLRAVRPGRDAFVENFTG